MRTLLKRTVSLIMALCMLISLQPAMSFSANAMGLPCSHSYTAAVTHPVCTEPGYTDFTCSQCGDTYRTPWLDETAYEGMTIACVGDSITAAYGVTKDETDYVTLLAEQLGMDYIRLGVSGTTLCTDGSRSCNIGKLTEVNLNGSDIVTIAMGVNDFCAAGEGYYELGDINSTDSSTIYGAMRMWCERIAELRKTDSLSDTQFYFLTPLICSWNNSVTTSRDWDQSKTNIHGYTLRDLCNAIIEVAALYDVAVIDLNLLSGMYYVDATNNNTSVFGGDGVHPAEKGHEMMADALADALLQNNLRDDHEHTFGTWITTTWSSCSAGEQQKVCTVCSAVQKRTTEPTGDHRYCTIVTHPTQTQQGYTTYTCSICGHSYVGDYTEQTAPKNYRWEMLDNAMVAVSTGGNTANALTLDSGSITDGTFTSVRYSLQNEIRLYHDAPWVIEWQSAGNWNGMLFGSADESPSSGLTYLFREAGMKLLAFGEYNSLWNNYGIIFDCDMTASHKFRLENRISADGSNAVYLLVDGQEIDAMHHYYISGNDQNKTVNWANGKDIVFANIGTSSHPVKGMKPDYIQIWEAGEPQKSEITDYSGKVISIMGDSISTFAGYIPTADGFNREHLPRYPQADLLTDVNETWWMQVVDQLDAKLGINDSWRGSTLSGAVPVTTGDTGENAAMSNLTRIQNLGSNGTPDVILLYGGTNDLAHVSKVGTFDPFTAPAEADLTTRKWDNLADGFMHTILRIRHYYPEATLVAMLPTYTKSYYSNEKLAQGNEVMAQICEHYGIPYVDLRDSGVTAEQLPDGIHPGKDGMDMITEAVIEALLSQCEMEDGENTVYSITHKLKNVKASLGHYKGISSGAAFTETLEGANLSVSVLMNGSDITESCYSDGKIHIPEVSGPLLITAESSFSLGDRLQQLPEGYQGENLWPLLRHDPDYYTVDGWGVHSSGSVKSVTIPVNPGDRLVANSFSNAGSNGGSLNGIRVTFFSADGLLLSMSADKVYAEYSKNGYLTVPDEAEAVCIPMWKEQGAELYLIRSEMEPKDFTYMLDEENSTITLTKYTGTEKTVSVLPKYIVEDKIYSAVLDSASVFHGNSAITSVKIHAGVSFKDDSMAYLFSECKNLVSVDMTGVDTSSITDMGYLFDWCSKLSSIVGYENWDTGSVINIYKMFNRTSALTKIDLSAWDLSQVINSGWCFQLCMASEILLPDNLKTISAGFLNHATQYVGTTFTLPSGVEKVGYAHTIYDFATNDFVEFKVAEGNTHYSAIDGILYSADGSEMLAIPRNKTFEDGIYEIPEGVSFLGELSFSRNYNIHKLVLPNSLKIRNVPLYDPEYIVFEDVGNLNAGNSLSIAIYCYTGITDYAVKEDNPNYASVDGIIYSKDMTTVVAVPSRYNKHMYIPEGVTTWLTEALWGGDSITVDNLMANCTGISIPASLTNIADDQIAKFNKLKGMFETFEIEVSKDNPIYSTDGNGLLILRDIGLKGDLDLNGSVNSNDLTLLARHVAGIETVTGTALKNSDVTGDGTVNSEDLTKHARYVAGIITSWDQE